MKKTLAALAFGATLLISSNSASSGENHNLPQERSTNICESLKPFLDEKGILKDDYLIEEVVFRNLLLGKTFYAKGYYLQGTIFTEIRDLNPTEKRKINGSYKKEQFNEFPFVFGFPYQQIILLDLNKDGCNGNETIFTDVLEASKIYNAGI